MSGRFRTPFRVGSTSYVFPAGLMRNIAQLGDARAVDDIQLILWDLDDGESNFPDAGTIGQMWEAAQRFGFSYSVHLPLDLRTNPAGDPEHASLEKARRVIALTDPLDPWAYIAHLHGGGVGKPGWIKRRLDAVDSVLTLIDDSAKLAIENVEGYDAEHLDPVVLQRPVSRTIDVGHLWKRGHDPIPVLQEWLPRTRVVHLHGFNGERDHLSLAIMPPHQLDPVVSQLVAFTGVVTLEVFSVEDYVSSRRALLEAWHRIT